jgi:hypothetical protein
VTRHALLGAFVIVFCVAGLTVGIVRLAPGRDAVDLLFSALAALVGAAAFAFAARVGRRGSPAWTKWLIVPILVSAFFLDRLSERNQLALLALASGYVTAFLVTVVVRAVRLTR